MDGKDLATLITCTPYGINTHRLLVTGERVPMDDAAVAAEAAQVKGTVMKPWMIAVIAAVVLILVVSAVIWLRSRTRKDEDPQAVEGAAAGALASADSEDEAGAQSGAAASASVSAEPASTSAEPASTEPRAPADAGAAPATPDLLADAEKISDEEIDAGRTAALKKMLEERGKQ